MAGGRPQGPHFMRQNRSPAFSRIRSRSARTGTSEDLFTRFHAPIPPWTQISPALPAHRIRPQVALAFRDAPPNGAQRRKTPAECAGAFQTNLLHLALWNIRRRARFAMARPTLGPPPTQFKTGPRALLGEHSSAGRGLRFRLKYATPPSRTRGLRPLKKDPRAAFHHLCFTFQRARCPRMRRGHLLGSRVAQGQQHPADRCPAPCPWGWRGQGVRRQSAGSEVQDRGTPSSTHGQAHLPLACLPPRDRG